MSLKKKITGGELVILAEMDTPKGIDITNFVTHASHLKSRIDAVVIPDMDGGVMHMSALAGGSLIKQQGMESMIHVYGRDRNRMALQGDLLAAHILGIHNLLVVKGETMEQGDHPEASAVNDLNEQEILGMIHTLSGGCDLAGFDLTGTPDYYPGYQASPFTRENTPETELKTAENNIHAGARYVILPPVFDISYQKDIIKMFKSLDVPVIATVFMLKNVGMARYISMNDPGSRLSESLIVRIRKAKDRERECIHIAGEMIKEISQDVQGIKVSAPGWEDRFPAILDHAGL